MPPNAEPIHGQRRAFICPKCHAREFLTPLSEDGPPADTVPQCPEHGPMDRQPNAPYMGQPVLD